jgi:hypothetical protein
VAGFFVAIDTAVRPKIIPIPMKRISSALFPLLVFALCSCGDSRDDAAKDAGSAIGETLTNFSTGVGKGIDKGMEVDVKLSAEIGDKGITSTISKDLGLDNAGKGISIYLISTREFKSKLIAKALNSEGMEVGRSVVEVELGVDDAKYFKFIFDDEMDQKMVVRYEISELN